MPIYMYNGPIYPSMLSGSGYALSRNSVECMYKEALQIPYFHLEVKKVFIRYKFVDLKEYNNTDPDIRLLLALGVIIRF